MNGQVAFGEENGKLLIKLIGRIDASNAADISDEIARARDAEGRGIIIDADKLEYISSAGLRIILKLRKSDPGLMVINASPAVYEIFEMTGFCEMMTIKKALRRLSVDGCELIGKGSNGEVYRYDDETIIKVYKNPDALPDIQRERELAKKALVLGINTAIPYDIVKIGEKFGTVMELLSAVSLSKMIRNDPSDLRTPLGYYIEMLKQIHSTHPAEGDMPDMKKVAVDWAEFDRQHLSKENGEKLCRLMAAIPDTGTMLHGDYHTNNVMVRDGEALLIDMDTLCVGHPIFEFGSMYNAYRGFSELDHEATMRFLGLPREITSKFWRMSLSEYFGTNDEAELDLIERRAQIIGYARLLRRTIRRDEPGRDEMTEFYRARLEELIPTIDSLV